MSLLDILCGALGAFCFMMLVALPYYKPPAEEKKLREAQEETNRLLRELEKMKDHMVDQKSVEDLQELVRRLEAQIKLLQGEVNRLSAENADLKRRVAQLEAEKRELLAENQQLRAQNQQLRARNQQLEAENQQLQAEKQQLQAQNNRLQAQKKQLEDEKQRLNNLLAQRKPFVLLASAAPSSQNVAIFLSDNNLTDKDEKSPNAVYHPDASEGSGWNFDRVGSLPGEGVAFWVTSAVVPKAVYKIYLRNTSPVWFSRQPISVRTTLFGELPDNTGLLHLPAVNLTRDRYWAFLGTITIDDNYRPVFKAATPAEQEAEWKAHSTPTPTPTPTPSPTPRPSPSTTVRPGPPRPILEEERAFREALRHMDEVMSMPGNAPGAAEKRREAIKQMEEARRKIVRGPPKAGGALRDRPPRHRHRDERETNTLRLRPDLRSGEASEMSRLRHAAAGTGGRLAQAGAGAGSGR